MDGVGSQYGQPLPKPRKEGRMLRPFSLYTESLSAIFGRVPNPDNLGAEEYFRILQTDETVASGIEFCQLSIIQMMGCYKNESKEAEAFVKSLWENCRTSLPQAIYQITSALWAGFSATEKVYRFDGNKIWLDRLCDLDPRLLYLNYELNRKARNYGEVYGVQQIPYTSEEPTPVSKLVLYSHQKLFGNSYGVSRLKPCFDAYVYKKALRAGWAKSVDRYGAPLALAQTDQMGQTVVAADGSTMSHGEELLKVLSELQNSSVAVISKEDSITFEQPSHPVGPDFERFENHMNKMILRALLIPALLFEPSDVGSFALGSKHFEIFTLSIQRIVSEIQDVIETQIYQPLFAWNLPGQTPKGTWRTQQLDESDLKMWSEIFFSLVNAGFLHPHQIEDQNMVRDKFGIDKLTKLPDPPPPHLSPKGGSDGMPASVTPKGSESSGAPLPRPNPRTETKPTGRPHGK